MLRAQRPRVNKLPPIEHNMGGRAGQHLAPPEDQDEEEESPMKSQQQPSSQHHRHAEEAEEATPEGHHQDLA